MPPVKTVRIRKYLLPISWIYGFIVFIRNKLFDWKILKQKSYDVPVICIGNITVGGTGKTPHIEYLAKLLSKDFRVAILSRGYKRKTRGFILSSTNSTSKQIGDEPYQIKQKFPEMIVAVDGKRTRAIDNLLALPLSDRPDVILLDDAFQHRYVKPSYTILLTDYNRLISHDELLPAGRLREPIHYSEYANSIIVTKCPSNINPLDKRITFKEMKTYPYQDLFYTSISYGNLFSVFNDIDKDKELSLHQIKKYEALVVTGIANPNSLHRKIRKSVLKYSTIEFSDHHHFSRKDLSLIKDKFLELKHQHKLIIVTEKDAVRLRFMDNMPLEVKNNLYYIPIEVRFLDNEEEKTFDDKIIEHVRDHKRNERLY